MRKYISSFLGWYRSERGPDDCGVDKRQQEDCGPHHARSDRWVRQLATREQGTLHDAVIKWKHFPRYWPFVQGIHRSPVNSPHKGQWRGALMFSLICAWINGWINKREAGVLRRHRGHYGVIVMMIKHHGSYIQHWAKLEGKLVWLGLGSQIKIIAIFIGEFIIRSYLW